MDMSTNESLGDPASILASIASIAENSAEQQSVSTESREVVNDVNRWPGTARATRGQRRQCSAADPDA